MAEALWYFARGGERAGPVPLDDLRRRVAAGEVGANDLVWSAGMAQWAPAGRVPELSGVIPATAAGAGFAPPPQGYPQPTAGGMVGYYAPVAVLPPRAAQTLRGHAPPTGDTSDWPLDDARLAQFEETAKLRRQITGAGNLYKLLFMLTLIGGVMGVLGMAFTVNAAPARRGARAPAPAQVIGYTAAFLAGLALLYYFTSRATLKSQRWAPLTMFILFLCACLLYVIVLGRALGADNPGRPGGGPSLVVGSLIIIALSGAFAIVSLRAFNAIPRYRAQPAWAQELLVKAGS